METAPSAEGSAFASVRNVLEWRAAVDPQRPAILATDRPALTYRAWHDVARVAERDLRAFGVTRADRLAIVLRDGAATAVLFAALSTNATAVPLDPAGREHEFERTFRQLSVTGVIVPSEPSAARSVAERLGLGVFTVAPLADPAAGALRLHCERPAFGTARPAAPDVCLLTATSGTTGTPKLVAVTERNLLAAADACAAAFALDSGDRCLFAQPAFHSAAMVTLCATLVAGASIVYPDTCDAVTVRRALHAGGVTWLSAPPAMCRELVSDPAATAAAGTAARLRFVRSGSALLEPDLAAELERAFAAPVIACYGMSEAPFMACSPFPPQERKTGSVGPARGCELAIRDGDGALLAPGGVGEVVVRGPNVFHGYGDPVADAQAFAGEWFRTGDVGRLDPDGHLFLLGRYKDIINRGGQKIFPAEVEDVLRGDAAIADVGVFGLPHPTLGEEVAAAVILQSGAERTENDVRGFAAARLAPAKVPKRVVFVAELPRTPTGKVRRHELVRLVPQRDAERALHERSATLLEAQLVQAFEAITGAGGLRSDDDFFASGGDSLRAVRLLGVVRELSGRPMTMQTLYDAPTPAALARSIASGLAPAATPLVRVQSGPKTVPLFFLHGDVDGGGVYVRHFARTLDPQRTVYALPPHGTNGIAACETIEAMACDYAERIERAFPSGPYLLAGYCNGGVVAYEVARMLRDHGKRVGALLLIASSANNGPFGRLRAFVRALGRALRWPAHREFRCYWTLRGRAVAWGRLRGAAPGAHVVFLLRELAAAVRRMFDARPPAPFARGSDAFVRMAEALARYFPRRYDGPVHHFWGHADAPPIPNDPTMGWGPVAPRIALHRVPGDHFTMVTHETEELTRAVRPLLACFD